MSGRGADGDWEFAGMVEAVAWGRSTYTVIRIPDGLAEDAAEVGTRRIAGTIEGVAVNLSITRAPVVEQPFVWAGRSLLRRLEVEAGAVVECRLRPVDGEVVPVPSDIATRLDETGMLQRWESVAPAERRQRLYSIESAGLPATRAKRIARLIEELAVDDRAADV